MFLHPAARWHKRLVCQSSLRLYSVTKAARFDLFVGHSVLIELANAKADTHNLTPWFGAPAVAQVALTNYLASTPEGWLDHMPKSNLPERG